MTYIEGLSLKRHSKKCRNMTIRLKIEFLYLVEMAKKNDISWPTFKILHDININP